MAGREAIARMLADATDPEFADGYLRRRFTQFVTESFDIIPSATDAFARGDLTAFGRLVDRSQQGAEEGLGNQVPATVALARSARALGAAAASAFGAGFGGSVWALVDAMDAERFGQEWLAGYAREFPAAARRAEVLVTRPSAGARRIN